MFEAPDLISQEVEDLLRPPYSNEEPVEGESPDLEVNKNSAKFLLKSMKQISTISTACDSQLLKPCSQTIP